jgi:3',5'-cyclic AMP phosphodiesterase CpdA
MFVLAHISDPHLAPLPVPRLAELASKRVLGFISWQCNRRRTLRRDVVDALTRDLTSQAPDHVAVTGDLVNIALGQEFANAQKWLQRLGPAQEISLVPGNHDAYVRSAEDKPALYWGDYMRGDDAAASAFPYVRRRGRIALIGLSTAVATPLLMATGRLGADQLGRCSTVLAKLKDEGCFRVMLIHHPPAGSRAAHKRLVDAEAFGQVLRRQGAELVLHGHDHRASLAWLEGREGRVPVVGVPAASAVARGHHVPAAYNLYRIAENGDGWTCEAISRGYPTGGDAIVELRRQMLTD